MNARRAGGLFALALLVCARVAHAQSVTLLQNFELSLGGQIGIPRGFVKVGEFDRSGDHLRLHQDLGVDHFEVIEAGAAYRLTPRDALRVRFDYTFLYGGTTLGKDAAFNGATLAAGTHLQTRPLFTRITGTYERQLLALPGGGSLAGSVGLTFIYLNFKLNGTLAASTMGHETQEDFYHQELPVPMVGLQLDYPLSERLAAKASVAGGFLPAVNSLRNEGGRVDLRQGNADVFLGLSYLLTPHLSIDGGYAYTYFTQHETSAEDNNNIIFLGHALGMNLRYRF